MTYAIAYIGALIVFIILDALWLGLIARDFYQREYGALLAENPRMGVAVIFYLGYVAGVVFFAVAPALSSGGVWKAALYGALLGLLAYGTYDATNLATLKDYSVKAAIVDTLWGTFLTGSIAMAGYVAATRFGANG
jgi:uncharacterized membrane protein